MLAKKWDNLYISVTDFFSIFYYMLFRNT